MTDMTPRLQMPLLMPGQAQKEVTHNEALALADMLIQPVVAASGVNAAPAEPEHGQCWIVGNAPTGVWAGKSGSLACFTAGGWRFAAPFEGMTVQDQSSGHAVRRIGQNWVAGRIEGAEVRIGGNPVLGSRQSAIAGPTGGSVTDAEARIAIEAILTAMRAHGMIAT